MEPIHSFSSKVIYNNCLFIFRDALIFRCYFFSFFSYGRIFYPSSFRLSLYAFFFFFFFFLFFFFFFFFLVLFLFLFLLGFPFKKYLDLVCPFYFKHSNLSFSFVFISSFICGVHLSLSLLLISTPYCMGLFTFPSCGYSFKAFYTLFWVSSPLLSMYRF